MIKFIRNRPVVTTMGITVIALITFLLVGSLSGDSIFEFIYDNLPVFVLGSVIFMIPIFINATNDTLKIDLISPDMVSKLRSYYGDYNNYIENPFNMIFSRLYLELADQRSHATKNLALGVGFTVIAVLLSIFLVVTTQSKNVQSLDIQKYLATFLSPKVAVIIFIEGIAFFFLRWYGKNLGKISEISDKILLIELKLAAQYTLRQDFPDKKFLAENILNTNIQQEKQDCSYHIKNEKFSLDSELISKIVERLKSSILNDKEE